MTYPPQQPGPYGRQNPWDQPPQGAFQPQQPVSQAPPWLTGDAGGFPYFEPEHEKKSRGGRIALVVILLLLLLGGGGFGLWMLLSKKNSNTGGGGEDGPDARTVAEKYVAELEKTVNTEVMDIDLAAMEPLTCADDFDRMTGEIEDAQEAAENGTPPPDPPGVEIGMKDFESSGDKGSFTLTQTQGGEPGPEQKMTMAKEDGAWKVCGVYGSAGAPAGEPTEAEPTDTEPTDTEPTDTEPTDSEQTGSDEPSSQRPVPNPIPTS